MSLPRCFHRCLLNNQPMGFYRPATIVKDAQRHGLKVFPIDVMKSEWKCTVVEPVVGRWSLAVGREEIGAREYSALNTGTIQPRSGENSSPRRKSWESSAKCSRVPKGRHPALRLGLRYVRGLREEAARAMVRQRNLAPFASIHDLIHRVPELRKDELNTLAEIGALNSVASDQSLVARNYTPLSPPRCPLAG